MRPEAFRRARLSILFAVGAVVASLAIAGAAITGASGAADHALLTLVRDVVPDGWTGFFRAITWVGSSKVLLPLAGALGLAFWFSRRRIAAALITASVVIGALLAPLIKTVVGRERPQLLDTAEYWGSSFPSGHTLVSTAFAMAVAFGVGQHWPSSFRIAVLSAIVFAFLVGLSRMVLGVHWPTDVAASWCIGSLVPVILYATLDSRRDHRFLRQASDVGR